jgi:hypothetical protein
MPKHAGATYGQNNAQRFNAQIGTLSSCEQFGLIRRDGRKCIGSASKSVSENGVSEGEQDKSKGEKNKQRNRDCLHSGGIFAEPLTDARRIETRH